jgi:hypothetical protein
MLKIWLLYIVFTFFMMIGVVFGHHKNEKYAFDKLYKYSIKKSQDAVEFKSAIINNEISAVVEEQINKKKSKNGDYGMVSFILFEDGVIKIDQFKKSKYRNGYMPSHSVGKSLVSLVTGYAICGGYIDPIDRRIDYPTVENTLYENQILLNLLNMTAGDEHIVGDRYFGDDNGFEGKGVNVNTIPIKRIMKKFKNTKPIIDEKGAWNTSTGKIEGRKYNYSAMTTNVIMNYVIYKTGDDWNKLLHKVFTEDAKVKRNVYFGKSIRKNKEGNRSSGEYGRYTFFADRYDYLRIAYSMMNHWNNDTCIGKYLKSMYENRIDKNYDRNYNKRTDMSVSQMATSYGGQFHFDLYGLEHKTILAMDGFAGQQLIIDFDRQRIIQVSSTDLHYDWRNTVYKQLQKD